ncbi:unnamed protein product [Acanthoscelides obtectus]|uniref:Phosphatidic acid phosphatase type 2/haloperoxidase domain-containing protein n=2 Tax=Acanthoscelides obtectus TaxID=200917 RepID=A0A9P0NU26_ACAOB|nr:unnamed protein product [Acanthoscelides obtectus]CAK1679265.1 Uncharacterized protein T28D9.3 [Acanthoscelides obtectus]
MKMKIHRLVLFIVLLIITEYGYIPGTKMGYTCQDPSISHKYRGEVITPVMLGVGCFLLPLLVLVFTEILIKDSVKRMDVWNLWFLYKECLVGGILVLVLTEMAKVIVGEHRPHFLDVCEPDTAVGCSPGSFIEDYRCTSTKYKGYFVVDSSRSFPSGHSSTSVFVGIFSAYIIHSRLLTSRTGYLAKPFLISLCLSWSLICSLTRITDRRHHWWDVLAGVFLGLVGVTYTICLVRKKMDSYEDDEPPTKITTSTTTLLDVKNKDATSVII